MRRRRANGKRLPLPIGIDELDGDELVVFYRAGFGDSKRVFQDRLDGAPDVDDLVAAAEESRCQLGQMVLYSLGACFVGLVDVDSLHGTAECPGVLLGGCETGVVGLAADGVVEDEDFGGAGTAFCVSVVLLYLMACLRLLQQLFSLWIINGTDFFIVKEIFLFAFVLNDLESMCVKLIVVFCAADIMDGDRFFLCWSIVGLWFTYVAWLRRRAVLVVLKIVQGCFDVMWDVIWGLTGGVYHTRKEVIMGARGCGRLLDEGMLGDC